MRASTRWFISRSLRRRMWGSFPSSSSFRSYFPIRGRDEGGPSASPSHSAKAGCPAATRSTFNRLTGERPDPAYAGTNLRFRKSTKTSTYVLLAFHLSVGREREKEEERGCGICEIEVARLYRFRYDEQKCLA